MTTQIIKGQTTTITSPSQPLVLSDIYLAYYLLNEIFNYYERKLKSIYTIRVSLEIVLLHASIDKVDKVYV